MVSERLVWIVRLIGMIVFLVLIYLLMSLHARLVRMNQEAQPAPKPAAVSTSAESP